MGTAEKPTVSIIVPVYNCSAVLKRCLDSILAQTFSNFEVLLVDDGSTDQSSLICRKYGERDERFRCMSFPHAGISAARNRGVEAALGKYLLFIDSDDYVEPDYAAILVQMISDSSDEIGMGIISYRQFSDEEDHIEHLELPEGMYGKTEYLKSISLWPGAHYYGVLWNKIYRADRAREIYFPDRCRIGEDFIFNMEYFCRMPENEKIRVRSAELYHYYKHAGSLSSGRVPDFSSAEARVLMYDAYRKAYLSVGRQSRWKGRMKLYMLRAWCEESEEWTRQGASREDLRKLYRMYIPGTGTGRVRCAVFSFLRKIRHLF